MLGGVGTGSPISVLLRTVLNRPAASDRSGSGDAKAASTPVQTASLGATSPGAPSPGTPSQAAAPGPLLSTASSLSLLTTEEATGLEGSITQPEQKTSDALAEVFAEEGQAAHAKATAMSMPAKGDAAPSSDLEQASEPDHAKTADKSEDTPSAPATRSPSFHAADSARSSSTIAFDGADAPWRVMMMAIPIEGDAQVVRLLVREDGHNETATGTTSGRRFVVDTHLRRIGRTQIDGFLSSDARLSVTLRHERPLPEGVAAEIRETSSTLATHAGLTLSLNLRESPDDFVDLTPPQPAGHRVGMSI